MKARFWAALLVTALFIAGSAQAQDYDGGDDAIRRGCPGFISCYFSCRNNYNDALQSCDWIDWTGFGAYCQAQAAYQLTVCVDGCYAGC
jgi:hypothetical protein